MALNIPNQITLARLGLALLFFVLLSAFAPTDPRSWLMASAFWVFLVAVLSDIVDGYLARSWGQVTTLGRVLDPVVDKVVICGAFVFFASGHFTDPQTGQSLSGVAPWMAVVILLRELLVSGIRSFAESGGQDFAANWLGKLKMFVQSLTCCVILGTLAYFPTAQLAGLRLTLVWVTVILTGVSIFTYLHRARQILFSAAARGVAPAEAAPPPAAPPIAPPTAKQPSRGVSA